MIEYIENINSRLSDGVLNGTNIQPSDCAFYGLAKQVTKNSQIVPVTEIGLNSVVWDDKYFFQSYHRVLDGSYALDETSIAEYENGFNMCVVLYAKQNYKYCIDLVNKAFLEALRLPNKASFGKVLLNDFSFNHNQIFREERSLSDYQLDPAYTLMKVRYTISLAYRNC